MARNGNKLIKFMLWLVGLIVTIAIGAALAGKTLTLPVWLGGNTVIGMWLAVAAGWIVIILALVGAGMALMGKLKF